MLDGCIGGRMDGWKAMKGGRCEGRFALRVCVAVEEEGGVILRGQTFPVQSLQVGGQIVDFLSIQELLYHIGGFQCSDSLDVLVYSS